MSKDFTAAKCSDYIILRTHLSEVCYKVMRSHTPLTLKPNTRNLHKLAARQSSVRYRENPLIS